MNVLREDGFLGGKLRITQPEAGFRAGLDAVMLAAALPATGGEALELGCGVGTAALCLARRVDGLRVTGVEIDADLVDIARSNAEANELADRVGFVCADAFGFDPALKRDADLVFCNPPFHDGGGALPPDAARARALHDGGRLADWLTLGLKRTRSNGWFAAILRADRLAEALAALPPAGGEILPLWPKPGIPAKRAILRLRKGAKTPLALLPGLILHQEDGSYTKEADAILRGEAPLL